MSSVWKLGGDLPVNRLGFGAMRITGEGVWGWPADRDNARKVLRRAVELGVNLIDTADAYGPEVSELLIAEALHPYCKGLVIATKGGLTRPGPGQWVPNGHPDYLKQCVDKSLKRLKLERIDLYQLHRLDPKVPMEESLGALDSAVRSGKALYAGISAYDAKQTAQAIKIMRDLGTPLLIHQPKYSMLVRDPEQGLLDVLGKEGVGCIVFSPLAQGLLSDRYLQGIPSDSRAARDFFLKRKDIDERKVAMLRELNAIAQQRGQSLAEMAVAWVLRDPRVTSALVGTTAARRAGA